MAAGALANALAAFHIVKPACWGIRGGGGLCDRAMRFTDSAFAELLELLGTRMDSPLKISSRV